MFSKGRLVVGAIVAVSLAGVPHVAEAAGEVRCLFVGIDDYGGLGDLQGCVADVQQMKAFIRRHFGPQRTTVTVLQDRPGDGSTVTWTQIETEIKKIARSSSAEDYFYFYYSGHGADDSSLQLPNEKVSPQQLADALAK